MKADRLRFRTYRPEDYAALCDFLIALNADKSHINWNWARFEWMYEHPECDRSLLGMIGLWLDGERIVGAAIYDMYFGEALCAALPDHAALYPEILDYAYAALKDESGLAIAIRDGNAFETETARAKGFFPIEQTETVMRCDLMTLEAVPFPDGLRAAELDLPADADAMQWVIFRGFDHGDDREQFEREKIRDGNVRLHFDPHLSLSAADGQGEPVAYCCLWYEPRTDYAYVEPVCTVPERRGKGVGKALVTEALLRARALGAKEAYVISDQQFYERIGFALHSRYTFFRKA